MGKDFLIESSSQTHVAIAVMAFRKRSAPLECPGFFGQYSRDCVSAAKAGSPVLYEKDRLSAYNRRVLSFAHQNGLLGTLTYPRPLQCMARLSYENQFLGFHALPNALHMNVAGRQILFL